MKKLAYIGLGVMGFPMAGHLRGAGFEVTVYNRSARKADSWCSRFGGVAASSPAAAVVDADMVFLCVGNDNDVREVICGDRGVLNNIKTEAVVVDHSTTSAVVAREMDMACRQEGAFFIDAPVSGGQQGAENGRLTVMAGGDQEAFNKAAEVMACYAPAIKYLGPSGSGQLCKMVNQICIAGLVQGLAEGLAFAEISGLDPVSVVDAISKGAAQSWQMDNRHRTMIDGDYEHGCVLRCYFL